ncbi:MULTISPECIES: SACOL1771 family peroxiredoxin [unclassified Staphylococcus]|uniref:SACOL1771 family peroxiredoxin n=1 Tax=unclassified Staphylococcus TaxID=91994 RepID=UPI0021CF9EE5|nr:MULTISPECIES: SACOL1771 family peroxiredoxin [unclassified Staphylococcus]UXR79134.1 SACOL1771 family peroxiredoxin [Staphylococcus sp. IVB6227]UXR81769.1 SACOL1771 family peroxiredoxin [Staphylococcus sp. IVB6214]
MIQHTFTTTVSWQGGRNEVGYLKGDVLSHDVSIPASLGGTGKGTNPDELLVAAASSCMTISLAATLERAHLTPIKIEMQSDGHAVFDQQRFQMKKITHYPKIFLLNEQDVKKLEQRIAQLISIADNNCMVSNSLKGNVQIVIIPEIIHC